MKEFFTNNLAAKLVSLVLATLVWAVIKRSQVGEPTPQPGEGRAGDGKLEFGVGVNGK